MRNLTEVADDPVFVGRPSFWSNPFEGRSMIGQARATILHRHWLAGQVTRRVLLACRFSEAEIVAFDRWRDRARARLPELRGRALRCTCRNDAPWCHRHTLREAALTATPHRRSLRRAST